MIYLVLGPDRLLAQAATSRIAREADPDAANTSTFDAKETPLDQVAMAVGSASFFGTPRVVIVTDALAKTSRETVADTSTDEAQTRPDKGLGGITSLLAGVPASNVLILHEPSLASAPAALKSLASSFTVIASDPPRGRELIAWIEDAARSRETIIDRRAAQDLAETLYPQTWDRKPSNPRYDRPPNLALLTTEIDKLALAAHPGPITVQHLRALVPGGPDQRLFRFVDAAMKGDIRTALGELDRLEGAGEEPAMLLAQVLGQAELAAPVSEAGSRDAGALARDLGSVTASRMSAVMSSARGRTGRRNRATIEAGVRIDRRLKSGRLRKPEHALYDLVIDLAAGSGQ
ncbi:MAG: hypothetical protein U0031_21040 [Thermomicrobiales bacterium]